MFEESATVVESSGDTLWVETRPRSACSQCAGGGCTTAVVAKLFRIKRNRLELENHLGAVPGERVVIGIPDDLLIRAALSAYLLPLLVLVAGAALGAALGLGEGYQSLLALAGLAIGFVLMRRITRDAPGQRRLRPQLLRRAEAGPIRVEIPSPERS